MTKGSRDQGIRDQGPRDQGPRDQAIIIYIPRAATKHNVYIYICVCVYTCVCIYCVHTRSWAAAFSAGSQAPPLAKTLKSAFLHHGRIMESLCSRRLAELSWLAWWGRGGSHGGVTGGNHGGPLVGVWVQVSNCDQKHNGFPWGLYTTGWLLLPPGGSYMPQGGNIYSTTGWLLPLGRGCSMDFRWFFSAHRVEGRIESGQRKQRRILSNCD